MNIVYSSNDNYARHLAVSVLSLLDSNRDEEEINIYILNVSLSDESIKNIKSIVDRYNRNLFLVDLENIKERLKSNEVPVFGFSIETYARLFLAESLPESAHRAMWIDCDTVVLDSLHDAYNADITDYALAAVIDQPNFSMDILRKDAGFSHGKYYNAGINLANLDYWREHSVSQQFVECFLQNPSKFQFPDQSIINKVLRDKILTLPTRYNVTFPTFVLPYKEIIKRWGSPLYSKEEYENAKKNPAIIHYTNYRPWKKWCLHPKKKYYRKYLAMTPYKDVPLENEGLFNIFKKYIASALSLIKAKFS